MKNQFWASLTVGAVIAAALVIGPAFSLSGVVARSVTPVDTNLDIDKWQAAFLTALVWCGAMSAVMAAIWLLVAHRGDGLDSKSGAWWALGCGALIAATIIAWLMPPPVQHGPGLQVGISAGLVLVAYWISTLVMTPNHYHHTPFLGKLIWGHKA